jgi:hypothetical protein
MKTSAAALEVEGALRQKYISALKTADQDDYDAWRRFVTS